MISTNLGPNTKTLIKVVKSAKITLFLALGCI